MPAPVSAAIFILVLAYTTKQAGKPAKGYLTQLKRRTGAPRD
jgi:hypothetical protein